MAIEMRQITLEAGGEDIRAVFVCDTCKLVITDIDTAGYAWTFAQPDDTRTRHIYIAHKGPCFNALAGYLGRDFYDLNLADLYVMLGQTSGALTDDRRLKFPRTCIEMFEH